MLKFEIIPKKLYLTALFVEWHIYHKNNFQPLFPKKIFHVIFRAIFIFSLKENLMQLGRTYDQIVTLEHTEAYRWYPSFNPKYVMDINKVQIIELFIIQVSLWNSEFKDINFQNHIPGSWCFKWFLVFIFHFLPLYLI